MVSEGVVTTWLCLLCDSVGAVAKADLESRKHTEATGHATTVHTGGLAGLAQCVAEVREQLLAREKRGA
jgi:hypothetical protein